MEHHIICPHCGSLAASVITAPTAEAGQDAGILSFLADRCDLLPTGQALSKDLWSSYQQWSLEREQVPRSAKQFGMDVRRLPGVRPFRTRQGRGYFGISLK